jgi:hypothetical protein
MREKDFLRGKKWFAGPYRSVPLPGGHFLHREHPDAFINALLRVLHDWLPEAADRD